MGDGSHGGSTGQRLCEDIYAMFDSFTTIEWLHKKKLLVRIITKLLCTFTWISL